MGKRENSETNILQIHKNRTLLLCGRGYNMIMYQIIPVQKSAGVYPADF